MRLLILHREPEFAGGAEKALAYYLAASESRRHQITVATAAGSKADRLLPADIRRIDLGDNRHFSLAALRAQARAVRDLHQQAPFDALHAWAARDWELAALAAHDTGLPTVGTLHDHPTAYYIGAARRRLMRLAANWGLDRIACVSEAVRNACIAAGYRPHQLTVIRNGLPGNPRLRPPNPDGRVRLGFLGALTAAKGFPLLFPLLEQAAAEVPEGWTLSVAGEAVSAGDQAQIAATRREFAARPWWGRVHWEGWVADPLAWLGRIDLLLFPSVRFDSLPTVLIEAGFAGVPALASRIGGSPEILEDGATGWLFAPDDTRGGADLLAGLLREPARLKAAGEAAAATVPARFALDKMVANYFRLYSNSRSDDEIC